MKLALSVQGASRFRGLPARATLKRWVLLALDGADADAAEIVLRFVDAREGRRLNRGYRSRDDATNVLTFDYAPPPQLVADIVLCVPVIRREARAQGKRLRDHLAHLVMHGVLHALGLDHQRAPEARRMEAREAALLARLGVPNPYS
jgi:probable rRNA maturation factor